MKYKTKLKKKMHTLPAYFECPIDVFLIDIINQEFLSKAYKSGITANMITTMGNVVRASAIYALYTGNIPLYAMLYFWGFQFDCLDGYFARTYNQTSTFGDYYDHASDIFFGACVWLWVWKFGRWAHLITWVLALVGMTIHIGCSQLYIQYHNPQPINPHTRFLDNIALPIFDRKWLPYSKYVGCGTFIAITGSLPLFC